MPKSDEQGYFLTYIGLLLGLLGLLLPIKTTFIWQWLVVWNMNFIFPFSWECISGWWFGTFGLFSHWVGNVIIPTDELHYFSEGRSTTSQDMIDIHSMDWFLKIPDFSTKSWGLPRLWDGTSVLRVFVSHGNRIQWRFDKGNMWENRGNVWENHGKPLSRFIAWKII